MVFGFLRSALKKQPPLTTERQHQVGDRTLLLRVVESERASRLTLRIETGGRGLKITVPHGLPPREVESFLTRHQGWLEAKLAKYPDKPKLRPGVKLPVRGTNHLILHEPSKRGSVEQAQDEDGPYLMVHGELSGLGRRLADFLKKQAKLDIEPMALRLAQTCGKKVKSIRFKDTKSRWGSCTSDGNLAFSWRIMMAPRPVIAYLVAHEVAHLVEMNHGPKFWKLCKELCEETGHDMDKAKSWLKRNGAALQAIEF
ncbi:MAG: M48 family metallopeptidase [Rhizobiaceae bacterium]